MAGALSAGTERESGETARGYRQENQAMPT